MLNHLALKVQKSKLNLEKVCNFDKTYRFEFKYHEANQPQNKECKE